MKKGKRSLLLIVLIFLNISLDQVSKHLIRENIGILEQINVIDEHLTFIRIENTGAFLSVGEDMQGSFKLMVLNFIPLIGLTLAFIQLLSRKMTDLLSLGLCFLIGGGMSNVSDRILYHTVTDFVNLNFFIVKTGIFNLADVSILIGIILLIIYVLRRNELSYERDAAYTEYKNSNP